MNRKLIKIKKLNDIFISKYINAEIYEREFSKLYYDEDLKEEESDIKLIEELWEWIDGYESDPEIRKAYDDLLDEDQLREKVKEFQIKIDKILNENDS